MRPSGGFVRWKNAVIEKLNLRKATGMCSAVVVKKKEKPEGMRKTAHSKSNRVVNFSGFGCARAFLPS